MARTPAIDRRLQRLAAAFTPHRLAAQRWYRTKSRGVASVELVDAGRLGESAGWLIVLEATDREGVSSRYLVPVVAEGGAFREPHDGEGVWRSLAELMVQGGEVAGTAGGWVFTPTGAQLLPGGPDVLASQPERRLGVEQSNTSVALGEALMLKLYRLVEPSINPEVEVNAFLTDVGFPDAPALAGSATYLLGDELHSAGMLQQLVTSHDDGWSWALDRLAAGQEGEAEAIEGVRGIGQLTAAMHEALASRPATPGFPSRDATAGEVAVWRAAAERQLSAAIKVIDAATRPRLSALSPHLTARFRELEHAGAVRVSRIHGDYHLGQLLRTEDGFAVIDFEGEPARPLAERRAPASPLRDLAGMLRSLDYAAHTAIGRSDARDPTGWLAEARDAFLDGYGGIGADEAPLLAAFELEKACYEVVYEANNRPDWLWLPLGALEREARATG